ncbi:MAG: hypothetical protein R2795_04010 [Saprospiraceae bacterium]
MPEDWFEDHHQFGDEHIGQVYELEDLAARMREAGFSDILPPMPEMVGGAV